MDKDLSTAISRYGEAYYSMAIGPGNIRERLIVAGHLVTQIKPEKVPEEISSNVKWINEQFSKKDTIINSMRWKHEKTCVEIAKRIVAVYCSLDHQYNS